MSTAATGRPSFGLGSDKQDAKKLGIRQKISKSVINLMISAVVWVFSILSLWMHLAI